MFTISPLPEFSTRLDNYKKYDYVTRITAQIDAQRILEWKTSLILEHGETEGKRLIDEISGDSMAVGSALHGIVECYLKNASFTLEDKPYKHPPMDLFNQMKSHLDKIGTILALETKLYSNTLDVIGKVDCIAEFDGVPSVIEFKNTRREKPREWLEAYFCQSACYSMMWQELTGVKISKLVIMLSGWDGSVKIETDDVTKYESKVKQLVEQYKSQ